MNARVFYLMAGGGFAVLGALVLVLLRLHKNRVQKRLAVAEAGLQEARARLAELQARGGPNSAHYEIALVSPAEIGAAMITIGGGNPVTLGEVFQADMPIAVSTITGLKHGRRSRA